jgi:elongation factor Ts
MKDYLAQANDGVITFAMIETRTAIANLDAILQVPGIDAVFVGPSDLSVTLSDGKVLDPHSKEVDEAIDKIAGAAKKAGRATRQGLIGSYIHAGGQLGVMVEVNCESDFVARTDDFKELVHDLAMHIAAADPVYLRREDVPPAILEKEREIARERARNEGKPDKVLERIVEGRVAKFYEEVCLLDQPFVKEATTTIEQLVKAKIAKLGENIGIARYVRFKVGDVAAAEGGSQNAELEPVAQ